MYLGRHNTPESKAECARLVAALAARGPAAPPAPSPRDVSVNEVLLASMRWAVTYYRAPGGERTGEVNAPRSALGPVRDPCGTTPAAEFGPRALAAVRHHMVRAGPCRNLVDKRVDRVRRVFRWAASEELVPVTVYQPLRTLTGLRAGWTDARESEPVRPADPAHVAAALPFLNRHVRAMVELQQLTGMRPGEVCRLTPGEVDRTGGVWLYRPGRHKSAHHGKPRVVAIGPKAQAVLFPFLSGDPAAPAFNPRAARAERYAALRAARKSKVPTSQRDWRVKNPRRRPAAAYTPESYAHAVGYAAEKAGVPHWAPNSRVESPGFFCSRG